MNSSGISRRIDELGRIVIPIEIRRILSIKEGDNLEFQVINKCINLKKINIVDSSFDMLKILSLSLNSVIDGNYFITNREKIIISSNNDYLEKELPKELTNLLNKHEESIISGSCFNIDSSLYVYPYYIENNISGLLVIYDIDDINKYKILLKFICSYIHDKITLS